MKHYLKDIILKLADAKVRFVIAGGVAVVLHGVERLTMDLDIALDFAPENVRRFLDVMKSLRMTPRAPVPPEILLDPEAIRMMIHEKHALVFTFQESCPPMRQVDVFLTAPLSFEPLSSDAAVIEVDGRRVMAVSAKRLLDLKRQVTPPRPKDLQDIDALIRIVEPPT